MRSKPLEQMSGQEFVDFVFGELERRNKGVGRTTASEVSLAAGYSNSYLRMMRASSSPNPSALAIRAFLYVLDFEVSNPEQDVIPHLRSKGLLPEASASEVKTA